MEGSFAGMLRRPPWLVDFTELTRALGAQGKDDERAS